MDNISACTRRWGCVKGAQWNVYTLTLPQSRKSRDRLPSIPPILLRQLVSHRGLSSAQLRASPKARLDHSGDFGPTPKWRLYRSSWTTRSSLQDAQHQRQCRSHCRWLADWPHGTNHILPWNFATSRKDERKAVFRGIREQNLKIFLWCRQQNAIMNIENCFYVEICAIKYVNI